jgi:hypothetical protein
MALPTPTSLKDADEVGAEVLYGRSATLRVFISSEMRTGRLRRERLAVASVVDKHPDAEPWLWERNARAGRYSSFEVCVGTARTSDILLLILADELTDVTEAEWRAAKDGGANCALFAKRIARRLRQSPRGLRAGLCVGGGRNRPRLEGGGGPTSVSSAALVRASTRKRLRSRTSASRPCVPANCAPRGPT